MKVFIEVKTAINNPPVGKEVVWISFEGQVHKGKLEDWENNHSWVNCTDGESLSVFDFEYWLKETETPDNDEIDMVAENYSELDVDQASFKDGITHILNLLNHNNEKG